MSLQKNLVHTNIWANASNVSNCPCNGKLVISENSLNFSSCKGVNVLEVITGRVLEFLRIHISNAWEKASIPALKVG